MRVGLHHSPAARLRVQIHCLGRHVAGEEQSVSAPGRLWRRLRTGAPWRDVPGKYGIWNSIYRRFRRWSASGVWESVATALAKAMAESGHYNIDSTTVRAHVSAAGDDVTTGGDRRLKSCLFAGFRAPRQCLRPHFSLGTWGSILTDAARSIRLDINPQIAKLGQLALAARNRLCHTCEH
jgi:transposase